MHNYITKNLKLPWTFYATECPTLESLQLAKGESTVGLVVTMPYKNAIIPHLDELEELATAIGACNNVYYKRAETGKRLLCGTNTDWIGIRGCLTLESGKTSHQLTSTALIIGAGGASRAAVYTLSSHLRCSTIYVLNRDDKEVLDLIRVSKKLPDVPEIVRVKTAERAAECGSPDHVVGTVPDLEPKTEAKTNVTAILKSFLERPEKKILLDMCFKPRRTRTIKLAESLGWPCVEGTHIIGYQIEKQYALFGRVTRRPGIWMLMVPGRH